MNRDWWSYSKDEQKQMIEDAVGERLSQGGKLTDRQKLLLRDAIGYAWRGLFGMSCQRIYELSVPESAWAPSARVKPAEVEGITAQTLRRWLEMLRGSPTQTRAIFCG